jgi:hypothetical protein
VGCELADLADRTGFSEDYILDDANFPRTENGALGTSAAWVAVVLAEEVLKLASGVGAPALISRRAEVAEPFEARPPAVLRRNKKCKICSTKI